MKDSHIFTNEQFEDIYNEQFNEMNAQLDEEILIAMIGDVNAGKSSTINRLMDSEAAVVGAKPGETTKITKYAFKDKIIFVDTPGLGDIQQEHSRETMQFYKEADIVLFFLNAAGTVLSDSELKSLQIIQKVNTNIIIVLNKIDAADEIPSLVKYIQDHTQFSFPVCPISSRTGENIMMLQNHILTILETKKKDVLMAQNLSNKSAIANRWILGAGASAGAIGVIPIPGADFVPLTSLQVALLIKLSTLYNKPISKDNAKELVIATIIGNIGKTVFRQIIKVVPGAGAVAGGSVAAAMTIALGHAVKYSYENNVELNAKALKPIYQLFLKKKN